MNTHDKFEVLLTELRQNTHGETIAIRNSLIKNLLLVAFIIKIYLRNNLNELIHCYRLKLHKN